MRINLRYCRLIMAGSTIIRFLKNREIDTVLWDETITSAPEGLIYARSFYLDNMAPGWDALAGENYEWVLPLTNKRKYGVSYLYQPAFTQQLGVFAKPGVVAPFKEIISRLQRLYRFCEVNWNNSSGFALTGLLLEINEGNNFVLNLSTGYDFICKNYHNDLIKNLKRGRRFDHFYRATNDYKKLIDLYREYYGNRIAHVKENDYLNFSNMCNHAFNYNMLVCREVVDNGNGVMAAALLLFDGKRLYNLMNTTTNAGRKTEANHFLINAIIEEFSGRDILLDFEGSDLPGVKIFYENFGAVNDPYFKLRLNLLPWPFKVLKK